MTKIKFCGLTREQDASRAAELGASYAGAVFATGARQVTPERAREIFDAAPDISHVGVFGRAGIARLIQAARVADLDVLQLHGSYSRDELIQLRQNFEGELWAVLPIETGSGELPAEWMELADVADALLLDTSVRGVSGGTGRGFDWKVAARALTEAELDVRIVLAGGLTPANVAEGISLIRPAIVDVSSGVELSPGIKDESLMSAFAKAVRSASIV